jgi:hypothetical protein
MKRYRRLSPRKRYQVPIDALESRTLLSATHHHYYTGVRYHPVPSARTGVVALKRSGPSKRVNGKAGASPNNSNGPVGKTPAQIRHAYGYDNVAFNNGAITGDGNGQTVAIIDAYYDPNIVSDLHQFDAQFGLADPTFNVINQLGQTITSSVHPVTDPGGVGNSWELETALDVEWVHAAAPGAAILLVETNGADFDDLLQAGAALAAQHAGVSVVSMSFGGDEFSGETSYDQYLATPNGHQGVTFVASTGDSGAPAEYPSVSPNVVAIGGTTLTLNSSGGYGSETGWAGSGGSLSTIETQPTFQNGVVTQSSTKRAAPDVAMDADPNSGVAVYDSYDNASLPWVQVGGTSLSAPLFSGLIAVANQGRVTQSLGTLNGTGDTLPKLYTAPAAIFHDITSGNNGNAAGPGYDLVTGRGSPLADQMVAYLAGTSGGVTLNQDGSVLVRRDADNVHADVYVNGTLSQQMLLLQSGAFSFTGSSGDDSFTFDFSQGDPLPTAGASVNGLSGANTISVTGTSGNDTVTAGISSVTITGGTAALPGGTFTNVPISVSNIQGVTLPGGSGGADTLTITGATRQINADTPVASGSPNVTVNVQGGASITFTGDQHLAVLNVDASAASLPFGPSLLSISGGLTLSNGGKLDLTQGELTVSSAATPVSVIRGYLTSGYNAGAWNASSGIVSSAASSSNKKMTLGYASSGDSVAISIPAGQIVVKYTTIGDANLSGHTDFNDYLAVQNNYGNAGNWAQGDFDYSGIIDFNDFLILQNGYSS